MHESQLEGIELPFICSTIDPFAGHFDASRFTITLWPWLHILSPSTVTHDSALAVEFPSL